MGWIRGINEELLPALRQDKSISLEKYWKHTNNTCDNRYQQYEWREIYQSRLRQLINSPNFLPYFSLSHTSDIDPVLYQKLYRRAAEEDDYIVGNQEDFEEEEKHPERESKHAL